MTLLIKLKDYLRLLKTNQFNLTTIRLTNADLRQLIYSKDHIVISLSHSDKFGDSGITGLAIISLKKLDATIDHFMLSCRIIGRKVEDKFLSFILDMLKKRKLQSVYSSYIKTDKNSQVADFFDKSGFELINENLDKKFYKKNIKNHIPNKNDNLIKIIYE